MVCFSLYSDVYIWRGKNETTRLASLSNNCPQIASVYIQSFPSIELHSPLLLPFPCLSGTVLVRKGAVFKRNLLPRTQNAQTAIKQCIPVVVSPPTRTKTNKFALSVMETLQVKDLEKLGDRITSLSPKSCQILHRSHQPHQPPPVHRRRKLTNCQQCLAALKSGHQGT